MCTHLPSDWVLQVKPSSLSGVPKSILSMGQKVKMYTYGCFKALSGYFTNILLIRGGKHTQARSSSFTSFCMRLNAYVAETKFPCSFPDSAPISRADKDTVMANCFLTGKWQCCHVETWASWLCVVLCLSRIEPLANCNWICADQSSLASCLHQAQGQAPGQSIGYRPRAQNFIYHPVSFKSLSELYRCLFFKDLQQPFSLLDHAPSDFNLLLVIWLMTALLHSMIIAGWLVHKLPWP